MATIASSFSRDANRIPIANLGLITKKSVTFSNTAGSGAIGTIQLFTVTGVVYVQMVGICNTDLVGAATLEVGVTGSTAVVLAQIADTTTLDTGELYVDASAATFKAISATVPPKVIVTTNIFATVASANITAGQVDFYCIWNPISTDGNVVAA